MVSFLSLQGRFCSELNTDGCCGRYDGIRNGTYEATMYMSPMPQTYLPNTLLSMPIAELNMKGLVLKEESAGSRWSFVEPLEGSLWIAILAFVALSAVMMIIFDLLNPANASVRAALEHLTMTTPEEQAEVSSYNVAYLAVVKFARSFYHSAAMHAPWW